MSVTEVYGPTSRLSGVSLQSYLTHCKNDLLGSTRPVAEGPAACGQTWVSYSKASFRGLAYQRSTRCSRPDGGSYDSGQ